MTPIGLYMDVHIPDSITRGLHARNVDVLTAQEDGWRRTDDPDLLARATVLNRVLFPFDDDFLSEAHRRQREGIPFTGLVHTRLVRAPIGQCIADLEVLAKVMKPDAVRNRIFYLSL